MSKKFSIMAEGIKNNILDMFVGAIRQGLTKGYEAAIQNTIQDSSNTAAHWLIGVEGRSNAAGRKMGREANLDLRETKSRGKLHPLIGARGDKRSKRGSPILLEVEKTLLAQELRTIISKYAAGQKPETKFYFYNRVGAQVTSEGSSPSYADSAGVAAAGRAAVEATGSHFQREIELGNVRRNRLK